MKVRSLLLLAAITFLTTGCLQNFKDSEFVIMNNSSSSISLHFNGDVIKIAPDADTMITNSDFREDTYVYSSIYSIPDFLQTLNTEYAITPGSGLGGELDFTSKGTKITLEYISSYYTKMTVDTLKNAEGDVTGFDTSYTKTYDINAISSEGWTD